MGMGGCAGSGWGWLACCWGAALDCRIDAWGACLLACLLEMPRAVILVVVHSVSLDGDSTRLPGCGAAQHGYAGSSWYPASMQLPRCAAKVNAKAKAIVKAIVKSVLYIAPSPSHPFPPLS